MEYILKENEQQVVKCGFCSEENYMYLHWHQEISLQAMQLSIKMYNSLQEEINCPYLIITNKTHKTDWHDLNEWLEKNWFPKASACGLKYVAQVTPSDFFMKVCALDLVRRCKPQIEFNILQDLESARNWIRSCQVQEIHKKAI